VHVRCRLLFEQSSPVAPGGSEVTFGYGARRLSQFSVADIEPPTKRVVIEGVPCTDYVGVGENGQFWLCVLAEDRAFGTLVIPAGSRVEKNSQLQFYAGRAFEAEGQVIPADAVVIAELSGKLIAVDAEGSLGD
jgi:hypothetical protein